jgi:hypothetical protein
VYGVEEVHSMKFERDILQMKKRVLVADDAEEVLKKFAVDAGEVPEEVVDVEQGPKEAVDVDEKKK